MDKKENLPFIDKDVAGGLFSKNKKGLRYEIESNSLYGEGVRFDFNYGIAYCNGQVAFRTILGSPLLVENILGSEKETDLVEWILKKIKINPKKIACRYGLNRINDEIRDLVSEKIRVTPNRENAGKRTRINNQIAFLRHIGALYSLQDEEDNKKVFSVTKDRAFIEKFLRESENKEVKKINKIKRLIGV